MPGKKIYAVKKGRQTGLFETWDECKRMVHGYAGAVYKSFTTKQEALEYLQGGVQAQTVKMPQAGQVRSNGCLTAYVDGSYDKSIRRYSFGCVLLTPDGETVRESASGDDPALLALHNVAGEMQGAAYAVTWALEHGYRAVEICYDYAGIEQWATGGWQAKKELTRQYADFMQKNMDKIQIKFTKIAAHTGDQYNEEADQLAKNALALETCGSQWLPDHL